MCVSVHCCRKDSQIVQWNCAIGGGLKLSDFDLSIVTEPHLGCISMPVHGQGWHTVICAHNTACCHVLLQMLSYPNPYYLFPYAWKCKLYALFTQDVRLPFIVSVVSQIAFSLMLIHGCIMLIFFFFNLVIQYSRLLHFQRSCEDPIVLGTLQIKQNITRSEQLPIKKISGLFSNLNHHSG